MITEIEQENLDIDWFFLNNKNIYFVASGGGKLPHSVSESDEDNKKLINFFRNLSDLSDVEINDELNKKFENDSMKEKYLSDFIFMSKKGLYSFDKTILNNFLDQNYHLVAKPLNPLLVDQLPEDIKKILNKTEYRGNINNNINIERNIT